MQKLYKNKYRHDHLKALHRTYIHKPKYRFTRYKSQAKIRKISFTLTFDDFMKFWGNTCFYCGEKVSGIGIDRLDNSNGYSKENCVSCCTDCNKMKMEKTVYDFIEKCKMIIKNYTR